MRAVGGDIIIKITDNNNITHHELYDAKGGETLSVTKYKKAVDKFLKSHSEWHVKFKTFNIISASPISARVFIAAAEQKKRLMKIGVQHQVLGADEITNWMKSIHSDNLIAEYFGREYIERLRGEEGLWQIKNQGVWGKLRTNAWDNFRGEEESKEGEAYAFRNEYVKIVSYLPKPDRQTISCFIDLRHHDYNHLLLTLSQDFLLKNAFEGTGTPPESECRPWFFKYNDNEYVCDFGNCRIPLPYNSVKGVCDAFDRLWNSYKEKINYIQNLFRTSFFRDKGYCSECVPIMEIPLWLWYRLYKFCEHHDFVDTDGEWSIFNVLKHKIMIFNHRGSHIFPCQNVSFRIEVPEYSDKFNVRDVVILWEPPSSGFIYSASSVEQAIRTGKYCDALTVHNWIKDTLLPHAFEWVEENKNILLPPPKGWLSRLRGMKKEHYNERFVNSFYNKEKWTEISNIESIDELFELVYSLQGFYNVGSDYVSFSRIDMCALYQAILLLISNTDFHYLNNICGCVQAYPTTYDNLLLRVHELEHQSSDFQKRSALIDMMFRAMIACQRDGRLSINNHEILYVCQLLTPFISKMNDRKLLMCLKLKHNAY